MHGILIAVLLAGSQADTSVVFDTQIIPVLTKAGCNAGACHGAAVGRGGFRLSLYGSDSDFDYRSIVHELEGRRVNLAHPDESLLLLKATESISHGGGPRLDVEGDGARLIRQWVAEGASRLKADTLKQLHVQPQSHIAEHVGASIDLTATAEFSPGVPVNVTPWTVFTADDPASIEIDARTASAKVLRRGRHLVIARYLDRVVPIEIIVPLVDESVNLSNEPRSSFIDRHILATLEVLKLPVSPSADDGEFLRRVTLDLTGRLPTLAMRREYLDDQRPEKRKQLVDRLLESDEFTEYWTLQLSKLLRIRSQAGDATAARVYFAWLKRSIADKMPYDRLARELLVSSGDTHEIGPANFYRTVNGAREQAEFVSELFMGTRLRCANCHNHPLDRWTQDDYHGLAAIFARVDRGRVVGISERGEVTHPRTGEAAVPRIPGNEFLAETQDGRQRLAKWLTAIGNPYFAKAIVNRLWKAMMGRGLIEPTDDLRSTNPATHPRLLNELTDDFVEHGFDLRHTLRTIALSETYRRSGVSLPGNLPDDRYYARSLTRSLEPEVLADAIADVTGIFDQYEGYPPGTRAVSLADPRVKSETLDVLGRCSRETSCEMSGQPATDGLTLKLHLMNGPLLNDRITDPGGRLLQHLDAGTRPMDVLRIFYKLALTREPTTREQEFWQRQFELAGTAEQQQQVLEDFLWSLLTCREFVTNH